MGETFTVDMSNFNDYTDDLESYVNAQGATLGEEAEDLQDLLDSLIHCYSNDLMDENTFKDMHLKFEDIFSDCLLPLN